jgi:hypothetical protein
MVAMSSYEMEKLAAQHRHELADVAARQRLARSSRRTRRSWVPGVRSRPVPGANIAIQAPLTTPSTVQL